MRSLLCYGLLIDTCSKHVAVVTSSTCCPAKVQPLGQLASAKSGRINLIPLIETMGAVFAKGSLRGWKPAVNEECLI